MPTISQFFGMDIIMRLNEHRPPHFHVHYGEHRASLRIGSWDYQAGQLPNRAYRLVLEWAQQHEQELEDNWNRVENGELPKPIEGL